MTQKELVENIEAVCKGLSAKFPGGANNIRCLTIKTSTSTALPLFLSLVSPNDVKTPVELSKKKGKPIEGELSTILGATAVVYPDGNVNVKRNKEENTVNDDSEDDEILKEVQKNLEEAKTVRTVDSDEESLEDEKLNKINDYDDMEADAVTDAMEQEVMSKYTCTPNQGNLSNSEEEDDLSSIDVEQKATKAQKQQKSKQSVKKETNGVKGSKGVMSSPHGGKVKKAKDQNKKNKINKNMRKAMIKKKNANKKK